ncbi:DUF1592 domain-containing protein [Sorangium cellulosum]|uniref:DUF1592 domain-containing protein n=1 Tax=Sorangium cellulosum TaxID=56 RepID=UPI001F48549D|nr:DUF1592 domain-containing protein [Sorangium cellulosum]
MVSARACRRYSTAALLLAGPFGCLGNLGDLDGSTPDDPGGGGDSPPVIGEPPEVPQEIPEVSACAAPDKGTPGPRTVRRLTVEQFEATVRDLFNDDTVTFTSIFNDQAVLGFTADANGLVIRDSTAGKIRDWAEATAAWAIPSKLSTMTSVTCRTLDESCRQEFIRDFGRRAFRAPLDDERVKAYDVLFADEESFDEGAKVVVSAMLQSPNFLYRREIGTPDPSNSGIYNLNQHEVASNLSYMLTGTMPDAALMSAADAGALATPEQISLQAERIMTERRPEVEAEMMRFMRGWLQLNRLVTTVKDAAVFDLTTELRQDMMAETTKLVVDVALDKGGTFADLLKANYTYLNNNLATHYGLGGAGGTELTMTMLNPGQRDTGILAHGSFLAGHGGSRISSPTQRGKMVRTRLLCHPLPPPPPGVDPNIKITEEKMTTRQRLEGQHTQTGCKGCHGKMDPIGFGFEHYDAFGRWRNDEEGLPIDSSGLIIEVPEGEFAFDGVTQLSDYLAQSEEVKECMVRYWSYYAFGDTWEQDGCTYDVVKQEAAANNYAIKSVWLGLAKTPHFTRRVQVEDE